MTLREFEKLLGFKFDRRGSHRIVSRILKKGKGRQKPRMSDLLFALYVSIDLEAAGWNEACREKDDEHRRWCETRILDLIALVKLVHKEYAALPRPGLN
jgi:hypothetical protein